jgi:hypothetical protein
MGTMTDSETPRIASLADQLELEIRAFRSDECDGVTP